MDIDTCQHMVVLESGEKILYHILVIATGSTTWSPFKTNIDNPKKETYMMQCSDIVEKVKIWYLHL